MDPIGLEDDFPFSNGCFSYPFLTPLGPFKHELSIPIPKKVDEGSDFGFNLRVVKVFFGGVGSNSNN